MKKLARIYVCAVLFLLTFTQVVSAKPQVILPEPDGEAGEYWQVTMFSALLRVKPRGKRAELVPGNWKELSFEGKTRQYDDDFVVLIVLPKRSNDQSNKEGWIDTDFGSIYVGKGKGTIAPVDILLLTPDGEGTGVRGNARESDSRIRISLERRFLKHFNIPYAFYGQTDRKEIEERITLEIEKAAAKIVKEINAYQPAEMAPVENSDASGRETPSQPRATLELVPVFCAPPREWSSDPNWTLESKRGYYPPMYIQRSLLVHRRVLWGHLPGTPHDPEHCDIMFRVVFQNGRWEYRLRFGGPVPWNRRGQPATIYVFETRAPRDAAGRPQYRDNGMDHPEYIRWFTLHRNDRNYAQEKEALYRD